MPAALIIGAGPNVGNATAKAFTEAGYVVAAASRSPKPSSEYKHFVFDASKPETVPDLFTTVRETVGIPKVVIYNAYAAGYAGLEDPFKNTLDEVANSMNVNALSAWAAAKEAVKGFEELGSGKLAADGATFIFTGNLLNRAVATGLLSFGMGKSASAHLIQHLAHVGFPGKPFKFYWGDERHEDGAPMIADLNGAAHAKLYLELAQDPQQRPWEQTFVNGKGYAKFPYEEVYHRSKN